MTTTDKASEFTSVVINEDFDDRGVLPPVSSSKSTATTALLSPPARTPDVEMAPLGKLVRDETKEVVKMSVPISVSYFLDNAMSTIALLFLGKMGKTALAGGSMGLTLCNTTGWSFGAGLLTALDTQAAHAWGAGKKKQAGAVTLRAAWIIALYCVPVAVLWYFAGHVMSALQIEPEVNEIATRFVLLMIPGMLPAMWFEVLRRYLQCMGVVMPVTIIIASSLAVEAGLLWLFVGYLKLGLNSCPLVISSVYLFQFVTLFAYVMCVQRYRALLWPVCRRKSFRGWWSFLKLAVPSALMSCMEGWGFDIMSVFAAWLGTSQLAVHSALINTYYVAYMIPLGVSFACTTRVGVLLGARNHVRARLSYYIVMVVSVAFQLGVASVVMLFRDRFAKIFCDDPEVVTLYAKVLPAMCVVMIVDGVQVSSSGALRGVGKQRVGMITNFVSFYVVGIPVGYAMAFLAKLDIWGIWVGLGACDGLSAAFFTGLLFLTSWKKVAATIATEQQAAVAAAAAAAETPPGTDAAWLSTPPPFSEEEGTGGYIKTRPLRPQVLEGDIIGGTVEDDDDDAGDGDDASPDLVRRHNTVKVEGDIEEAGDYGDDDGEEDGLEEEGQRADSNEEGEEEEEEEEDGGESESSEMKSSSGGSTGGASRKLRRTDITTSDSDETPDEGRIRLVKAPVLRVPH